MIPSGEESSSKDGSEHRSEEESFVIPLSLSAPDALTNWWCIEGIKVIYFEGVQPKEWGKPTHSIYEEP